MYSEPTPISHQHRKPNFPTYERATNTTAELIPFYSSGLYTFPKYATGIFVTNSRYKDKELPIQVLLSLFRGGSNQFEWDFYDSTVVIPRLVHVFVLVKEIPFYLHFLSGEIVYHA